MDAMNGVSSSAEVYTSIYNLYNNNNIKEDIIAEVKSDDSVEISEEAKVAQKMAKAFKRSEDMMRLRNLSSEEIAAFREILQDYNTSGKTPSEFLKSLDKEERDLIKRANSYGHDLTDSEIDSWSVEGSKNMLREQDWRFAIDLNDDGIVDHGGGKSFVFPPPNSPEEIKDSWEMMSENMTDKEKMFFTIRFAPIKIDGYPEATTIVGYDLNEQGFPKNIDEWLNLLDKVYETEEYNSKINSHAPSREISKRTMELITEFKNIIYEVRNR